MEERKSLHRVLASQMMLAYAQQLNFNDVDEEEESGVVERGEIGNQGDERGVREGGEQAGEENLEMPEEMGLEVKIRDSVISGEQVLGNAENQEREERIKPIARSIAKLRGFLRKCTLRTRRGESESPSVELQHILTVLA